MDILNIPLLLRVAQRCAHDTPASRSRDEKLAGATHKVYLGLYMCDKRRASVKPRIASHPRSHTHARTHARHARDDGPTRNEGKGKKYGELDGGR
jgi:hypothetical protein